MNGPLMNGPLIKRATKVPRDPNWETLKYIYFLFKNPDFKCRDYSYYKYLEYKSLRTIKPYKQRD